MYRGWTVSVAMPAYNEAGFITSAVREFLAVPEVDDVLVVDNNSSDDTGALARAAGARVVTDPWAGFAAQRNVALDHATSDWVLEVDADERITPELADEIRAVLAPAKETRRQGDKETRRRCTPICL